MTEHFNPNEWSRVYDDPSGPAQNYVFRRTVEVALDLAQPHFEAGRCWLDAGCGPGVLLREMRRAGVNALGADHDPRMAARAAPAVAADVELLPFPPGSFDGVVATSLAGCLASPAQFFAETHRVLKHGGRAILSFTNQASLLLKVNHRLSRPSVGSGTFHLYRAKPVTAELERLGFVVEQVKFYNFVLHRGRTLLPPASIARSFDSLLGAAAGSLLARNFAVVVRKSLPQ